MNILQESLRLLQYQETNLVPVKIMGPTICTCTGQIDTLVQ